MAAEDGLKAQKLLAQGIALGNVGKKQSRPERAKAFNIKAFALSGRLFVLVLKPRAMPWARCFCPFRAYWIWLMTHPPELESMDSSAVCGTYHLLNLLFFSGNPPIQYTFSFLSDDIERLYAYRQLSVFIVCHNHFSYSFL